VTGEAGATFVRSYSTVIYRNVWPNIDVRLRIVLLAVYPVLLGTGKRFPVKAGLRAEPLSFADGTPAHAFQLISTQAFPSGIIFNTYKVAGPLKIG